MNLIDIPFSELSPEALRGVLEEYATRGGFESDVSLETRISEITTKLKLGKAKLVFDPESGMTNVAAP